MGRTKTYLIFSVTFLIIVVILLVVGSWLYRFRVNSTTIVYQGECTFKAWVKYSTEQITMQLDCGGESAWTRNVDAQLAYLEKPQPLYCSVNFYRNARCRISE